MASLSRPPGETNVEQRTDDGRVVVTGSIKAGDRVAVAGLARLADGVAVKLP